MYVNYYRIYIHMNTYTYTLICIHVNIQQKHMYVDMYVPHLSPSNSGDTFFRPLQPWQQR